MTALSAETRRLLQLSRSGDHPTAAHEQAVRDRLIAQLGVTALAGVAAASAAVGAAEAAGVTSASMLATGAPASAVGSAAVNAVSTGATTVTLAKTVAGLVFVAGLGTGAWKNDDVIDQAVEWPATVAVQVEQAAKQTWRLVMDDADRAAPKLGGVAPAPAFPSIGSDARRHARLITIARRPNRPVAKEAELVLILGAEEALTAGDAERAARYLDEHEARFAGGELSDNREKLRVLVDRARDAVGQPHSASPSLPRPADKTNF